MTTLLSDVLSTSDSLQLASIVCASILSLVLIGVTFANVILSIKASRYPIKAKLIDGILNYDAQLYTYCTKIVNKKITDPTYVYNSIDKLDDANTELYSNIIKLESEFPKHNSTLIKILNDMYEESEYLCAKMNKCKEVLVPDIATGRENVERKNVTWEFLVKDLLAVDWKFNIFSEGLHKETVDFLESFIKVNLLLEKIDYKKFMRF